MQNFWILNQVVRKVTGRLWKVKVHRDTISVLHRVRNLDKKKFLAKVKYTQRGKTSYNHYGKNT